MVGCPEDGRISMQSRMFNVMLMPSMFTSPTKKNKSNYFKCLYKTAGYNSNRRTEFSTEIPGHQWNGLQLHYNT